MSSTEKQKIPWGDIGEPLADLLRYEREIGYYEHASYALLSTVVHETTGSAWQKFLLVDDNFAAVVEQIITISDKESKNPKEILDSIRELVNAAYTHTPERAGQFLIAYLKYRPSFPVPIREELDTLSMQGKRRAALRAIAFASEMERLQPFQAIQRDSSGGVQTLVPTDSAREYNRTPRTQDTNADTHRKKTLTQPSA